MFVKMGGTVVFLQWLLEFSRRGHYWCRRQNMLPCICMRVQCPIWEAIYFFRLRRHHHRCSRFVGFRFAFEIFCFCDYFSQKKTNFEEGGCGG